MGYILFLIFNHGLIIDHARYEMKITIDKIESAAHNQKPGLADISISNEDYEFSITLSYNETNIEKNQIIENGSVLLYHYLTGRSDFAVYKDVDSYYKESESCMAEESIISVGMFPKNKSAYNMVNGKVSDVHYEINSVYLTLECNGFIFPAIIEGIPDQKIEKGNIIHAVWWAELVTEEGDNDNQ